MSPDEGGGGPAVGRTVHEADGGGDGDANNAAGRLRAGGRGGGRTDAREGRSMAMATATAKATTAAEAAIRDVLDLCARRGVPVPSDVLTALRGSDHDNVAKDDGPIAEDRGKGEPRTGGAPQAREAMPHPASQQHQHSPSRSRRLLRAASLDLSPTAEVRRGGVGGAGGSQRPLHASAPAAVGAGVGVGVGVGVNVEGAPSAAASASAASSAAPLSPPPLPPPPALDEDVSDDGDGDGDGDADEPGGFSSSYQPIPRDLAKSGRFVRYPLAPRPSRDENGDGYGHYGALDDVGEGTTDHPDHDGGAYPSSPSRLMSTVRRTRQPLSPPATTVADGETIDPPPPRGTPRRRNTRRRGARRSMHDRRTNSAPSASFLPEFFARVVDDEVADGGGGGGGIYRGDVPITGVAGHVAHGGWIGRDVERGGGGAEEDSGRDYSHEALDEARPLLPARRKGSRGTLAHVENDDLEGQRSIMQRPSTDTASSSVTSLASMASSYSPEELLRREERRRLVLMASTFLADYEASRAPTLPPDPDEVGDTHLILHRVKFSALWRAILTASTICLFAASCYERPAGADDVRRLIVLTFVPVVLYTADMIMMGYLFSGGGGSGRHGRHDGATKADRDGGDGRKGPTGEHDDGIPPPGPGKKKKTASLIGTTAPPNDSATNAPAPAFAPVRISRSRWWAVPLAFFLVALSLETIVLVSSTPIVTTRRFLLASAFKPVVFFYASPRARNALDAMNRVSRTVFRVLFIELFLIFTFSAVACQVYGGGEPESSSSFRDLRSSFLSMFELSTTVVNPSLWMPVYARRRSAAVFFVVFLVTSVFYLHSLVLSVVFQSYMEGLMVIRDHASSDREETLRLAFRTMCRMTSNPAASATTTTTATTADANSATAGSRRHSRASPGTKVVIIDDERKTFENGAVAVSTRSVKRVLTAMRPHYGRVKIDALVDIVDPLGEGFVDYTSFRSRMPKALNTSVRSTRQNDARSLSLRSLAAFVAGVNLLYVVLASSTFHAVWWLKVVTPLGWTITALGIMELLARLIVRTVHRPRVEVAEPSVTFDGLAVLAALVSLFGVFDRSNHKEQLDWIITGRSIDMIRCLRLTKEARSIVKRSGEVFPALLGPLLLLVTAVHVFCYVGMAVWGGAIDVGSNVDLSPFYDLNNFNQYTSGLLTMFQVLVVNDWHAIAEVFVLPQTSEYANTNRWVYPFFVAGNLINVSILLNVLTAFFVGAFVTKVTDRTVNEFDIASRSGSTTSGIVRAPPSEMKRVSSSVRSIRFEGESSSSSDDDDRLVGVVDNRVTMSEKQNLDTIMRTVAGKDEPEDDEVKKCCHLLELFESLSMDKEKMGYLVSCQQSMKRFGNQRFQSILCRYMDEDMMHCVVSEMQTELTTMPNGHEQSIHRLFSPLESQGTDKWLEITASLVNEGSSVALFVAKVIH